MKRLLGPTLVATAWISVATALAAEPERIRGTVSAVLANTVTVHTETGGNVTILLSSDTKYLTEARSDLDHISTGSYVGVAAKDVGDKLVALDVLIFPPSLKGANEGHFAWDKLPDTTLSGGTRASSTMTNGSVAAVVSDASSASVDSTMTNGSIATATAKGGTKQLRVTYEGGEQTILAPPTASIVTVQPGAMSDLKVGDGVFVNAIADGGKTTAGLILIGSDGVVPPI
ncbi:MAG TPA: metal ABC transporter permease [Beijerinckiaceae bacterium]|jgi:hypothetical protein|nr:metal ABC transporter permease [Beijerinckiaceae bacterium]